MSKGPKTTLKASYSADVYLRKIRKLDLPDSEKSIIASTLWLDCFSNCPSRDHISEFDEYMTYPLESYDHEKVVQGFVELGFEESHVRSRLLSETARKSLSRKSYGSKSNIFENFQRILQTS